MNKKRITRFFLISGLCFLAGSVTAGPIVLKFVFGNACLSFFLAALGYGVVGPRVFLKQRDGRVPLWGYLFLWPYFTFYWLSFIVFQSTNRTSPYFCVSKNLFLGRVPTFVDRSKIEGIGITNVLDLASEYPEPRCLRNASTYLFVPLMDTEAPGLRELQEAVAWIRRSILSGPTFVHCAFGHGRSVTFVTAYLLNEDPTVTVEAVVQRLRDSGRKVHLSKEQQKRLHQFRALPAEGGFVEEAENR